MGKRSGGAILVDCLRTHGVDRIFGVPGESYLPALDALHDARDAIQFVVCRQEGGAAFMADAYAKLTGKPGICFVTRGPGACNASVGVHTAFQDSSPMIVLVGQVARDTREREAFQEVEYKQFFAPMGKWICEIDDAARIPEHVSHAFHLSLSGRPGPVVLVLPEDMLADEVEALDVPTHRPAQAAPSPADLAMFRKMLSEANRPVLIAGGGGWSVEAKRNLEMFAERMDLAITTSFRCQDYFDNRHDNYVGDVGIGPHPALAKRVADADLIIALGPRLGEMTTQGYTLFTPPVPRQKLIHIHPGSEELGRVFAAQLLINSSSPNFLEQAVALEPIPAPAWKAWRAEMRAEYLAGLKPRAQPGPIDMGVVIQELARQVPEDSIICNGAGNYTGWIHKIWRFSNYRSQLAPTSGTMGYGFPAAVAAKLTYPERTVIAVAGDGCFLMNGQEMATAALHKLPIIVLIVNNGIYGTILMHQERQYPGRPFGIELANPDFAQLGAAYGAHSELVTETAAFGPALARALASKRLALIELRVSPESISTARTLTEIRQAATRSQ